MLADGIPGARPAQLLADLRERVQAAVPRAAAVFLMPVNAVEEPPELTPPRDPVTTGCDGFLATSNRDQRRHHQDRANHGETCSSV